MFFCCIAPMYLFNCVLHWWDFAPSSNPSADVDLVEQLYKTPAKPRPRSPIIDLSVNNYSSFSLVFFVI